MHVFCSCDVRCALGFVEDATLRIWASGARTLTREVTCQYPALYVVHTGENLNFFLQQIRGLDRSAHTAEERAIGVRVTAAELRLSGRFTTPTGTTDLSWSATWREGEDVDGECRGTTSQQP